MEPETYHFVLSDGSNSNSIGLEVSETRSHAAKVSHSRNRAKRHALGATESHFAAETPSSLLQLENDESCHSYSPSATQISGDQSRRRKFRPTLPNGLTGAQFTWRYRDYRPGPKASAGGSRANTDPDGKQSRRSHFPGREAQTNRTAPASLPKPPLEKQNENATKNRFATEAENPHADLVGMTPVAHDHLDPFLQLAGSSSRQERNLIHYCNVQRQTIFESSRLIMRGRPHRYPLSCVRYTWQGLL